MEFLKRTWFGHSADHWCSRPVNWVVDCDIIIETRPRNLRLGIVPGDVCPIISHQERMSGCLEIWFIVDWFWGTAITNQALYVLWAELFKNSLVLLMNILEFWATPSLISDEWKRTTKFSATNSSHRVNIDSVELNWIYRLMLYCSEINPRSIFSSGIGWWLVYDSN